MTLSQVPDNGVCRITTVDLADAGGLKYWRNGLHVGGWLHVICRHPFNRPHIIEVELENQLRISVPISIANKVSVKVSHVDGSAL